MGEVGIHMWKKKVHLLPSSVQCSIVWIREWLHIHHCSFLLTCQLQKIMHFDHTRTPCCSLILLSFFLSLLRVLVYYHIFPDSTWESMILPLRGLLISFNMVASSSLHILSVHWWPARLAPRLVNRVVINMGVQTMLQIAKFCYSGNMLKSGNWHVWIIWKFA